METQSRLTFHKRRKTFIESLRSKTYSHCNKLSKVDNDENAKTKDDADALVSFVGIRDPEVKGRAPLLQNTTYRQGYTLYPWVSTISG